MKEAASKSAPLYRALYSQVLIAIVLGKTLLKALGLFYVLTAIALVTDLAVRIVISR